MQVKYDITPWGEYTAIDEDSYDGPDSPMGWGSDKEDALDDLKDQMRARGLLND